jgi:hypothetical protein
MPPVEQQLPEIASPKEFDYLLERIAEAPFESEPFRHLYLEDFLSPDHLSAIINSPQVKVPPASGTLELLTLLDAAGYDIEPFPGCTTDVPKYLAYLHSGEWPDSNGVVEGIGMAMRLKRVTDPLISRLLAFLNGERFHAALTAKFGVERPNRIETAIQKYLSGYEISPHPDIRSKCLTYLLNINTDPEADRLPIHTHLLRFIRRKEFIYSFWETNPEFDRCWVLWSWCTSERVTSANNSILLFSAHNRSLHAIKLKYEHTRFQRTQVYGNLWYTDVPFAAGHSMNYKQFDFQPPAQQL